MKPFIKSLVPAAAFVAGAFMLVGCGAEDASVAGSAPEGILLRDAPADAPGLLEALETTPADAPLVFSARAGGTVHPLSRDFAVFLVADESLVFCDEEPGDSCGTPWDACCEDPAKIAHSRALVQFVNEAGDPLMLDLATTIGLAANDTVIVRGRLAPDDGSGNRLILAEGIALAPDPS